jgi:hypothetical protein
MAAITFTIDGPPNTVTLGAFVAAFRDQLVILNDVDRGISGKGASALEWVVTDLQLGSLSVRAESRFIRDDVARTHDSTVARTYRNGLYAIEGEGNSPGYYSERGMVAAKNMFQLIGHDGVTGFRVTTDSEDEELKITPRAAVNIVQLLKPGRKNVGAIEGRLNVISLATKRPKMVIYEGVTHKGVSCFFAPEKLADVKDALGKRVIISGTITYNRRGEPQRIRMDTFRVLRARSDLPTEDSVELAIPRLTASSTKDYLDLVRER